MSFQGPFHSRASSFSSYTTDSFKGQPVRRVSGWAVETGEPLKKTGLEVVDPQGSEPIFDSGYAAWATLLGG
jgi:hypothetical protein